MKLFLSSVLALVLGITTTYAQQENFCTEFIVPQEEMVMNVPDLSFVKFVGIQPIVVSRVVGEPMVKILRYTAEPMMETDATTGLSITSPDCNDRDVDTTSLPTGAPVTAGGSAASSRRSSTTLSTVALLAGAYLTGGSPSLTTTTAMGAAAFGLAAWAPMAAAQDAAACLDVVEVEISGPAVGQAEMDALVARVAELEASLSTMVSMEEATQMSIDVMVENFARNGT